MKLRSRAAARYAAALYDLAAAARSTDAVARDMRRLQQWIGEVAGLNAFLANALLPRRQRQATLSRLFEGAVEPLTWRFLCLVESKRRMGLLNDICASYLEHDEARQGVVRGELTVAMAMAADEAEGIAARAGRRIGKRVVLRTAEDPALLGGYRLQVGDKVYDLSLAARLRMLRRNMTAA
jgi:F-type H+-transporting ATPase subunit delta